MRLSLSGAPWLSNLPPCWPIKPIAALFTERNEKNDGIGPKQLLSLSYGKVVRRDIDSNDGLRPESYGTYQQIKQDNIVLRLIDLQNDKRSIRVGQAVEPGIITSAYVALDTAAWHCPKYAFYLLLVLDQLKVFYGLGSGMRQSITFSDLGRIPVAVPSDQEQHAIAVYLDAETARIDALINAKEELLQSLGEMQRATLDGYLHGAQHKGSFTHSGSPFHGKLPHDWHAIRLKFLLHSIEQGWSPQTETRAADQDEWGVLKAGACNGGVFRSDEQKALPKEIAPDLSLEIKAGDLLMSRGSGSAELVGSVALVPENVRPKLLLCDLLYRLRIDDLDVVNPQWLVLALNSSPLRRQIRMALRGAEGLTRKITTSEIKELVVALPPKAIQDRIVERYRDDAGTLSALQNHVTHEIAFLRELRSSTITDAVLGRIDVHDFKKN